MASFFERNKMSFLMAIFSRLQFGRLTVKLPNGEVREFEGAQPGPSADLHIQSMNAVSRMISDGKMGFCEAVMDGEATSSSMAQLIELAVLHDTMLR